MSKHKEIRSGSNKARRVYDRQRARTEKNKNKHWDKHLEKNPNDLQAKTNIKRLRKQNEEL